MPVNLGNWDSKLFQTDVIKAFVEAGRISDNSYIRSNSNESQIVYGNMASITVSNTADNTELADAGATETATTISADSPLKGWVYIPKSVISTHGSANVVANYAQMLGVNIREQFEKRISNLLCTSSPTTITFDDEATGSTLATEVANTLARVAQTFDEANVPAEGRYVLLRPSLFTTLWQVAGVRSGDFISGADNSRSFNELNFLGMNVRSFSGNFGVDTSSNTAYDAKYRVNMTVATGNKAFGVAWHRTSLGVNFYEDVSIEDGYIFDKDSILVKGRVLMGTGLLRGAGARILIAGD